MTCSESFSSLIFSVTFKKLKVQSWPTVFTRPHITHFEIKNSRSEISILTASEITPTTILKHVFHETTHEEVYIRIILKVNA